MKRKSIKAKLRKTLVTALTGVVVAGSVLGMSDVAQAGNREMTPSIVDDNIGVGSPYSYSVFTRNLNGGNHIEGTIAAENVSVGFYQIYGMSSGQGNGGSYIAQLNGAKLQFSNYSTTVVVGDSNFALPSDMSLYDVTADMFCQDCPSLSAYSISKTANMIASMETAFAGLASQSASYKTASTGGNTIVYALADGSAVNDSLLEEIQVHAENREQVIVNVGGSNVYINANWNAPEYAWWAGNIVWNFYDASYVQFNKLCGTIYALNAEVYNVNNIVGRLFCSTFSQNGEVHAPDMSTEPSPTPTPEETPTPTPEETPTPTPEETPTPTPEETPTPTPEETPTPTPEETPTPTPEETPTPTPEETPTPTPEETPTPTPEETPTPTPEETPTPTPEETPTPTPEETPTPTPEETPTPTPEETPTPTPEETPTPTPEETPTPTPEETPTPTPEETPTPTPTPTPSPSPSPTPTPSVSPSPTPSETPETTPPEEEEQEEEEEEEVLGGRRYRTIEDEETPLSDSMVLGSRRRPQTSDESDIWMVAFLASMSGLVAWLLQGKKRS